MKPVLYLFGTPEQYPNYVQAVTAAGGEIRFSGSPAGCSGLLLPGGGDLDPRYYGQTNHACRTPEPSRDKAEMALLDYFVRHRRPVLGICRGLQVINVFFGGTLVQDLPGHNTVDAIDRLHTVHTVPSPFLPLCSSQCIVNSAHHQAVDQLGEGLLTAQWSADGTVEALFHTTLPIWAVQWHPERLQGSFQKAGTIDGSYLFCSFLSLCGAEKSPKICR